VSDKHDDYINSYQRWVEETTQLKGNKDWNLIALMSEVGEFCQLEEKCIRKGTQPTKEEYMSELGDVLWNVVSLCNMYGMSLSEVMKYNIDKVERRRDGR